MHSHTLAVLGLDLTFRADADPLRIERARALLEERYERLAKYGGLSKEKLLTFLALSLADDVLLMQDEKGRADRKVQEILGNMEKVAE
jgi:cell division protein ZapA